MSPVPQNVSEQRAGARASIAARWERIDWAQPVAERFVIPERHYLDVAELGLDEARRIALNRLFACFTCELFVHFEGYVITYLERHHSRVPWLTDRQRARFVDEEAVHSAMFRRLLRRLRPDLYPRDALFFLRWNRRDELALFLAPVGTFFLLAWLFEEITLGVPQVMAASPEQACPLVAEVMRLHAQEEAPHVALDRRVLAHLTEVSPRWLVAVQSALTLPFLAHVDTSVRGGWRRLVTHAASELRLSPAQVRALLHRGPSQSDRLGMASFVDKVTGARIAGTRPVCWALRQQLRQAPR